MADGKNYAVAVVICVLMSMGGEARADEPVDLPTIDKPGQQRMMTLDDATSTSKCIGNPITPLCAVETVRACLLRKRYALCKMVLGDRLDDEAAFIERHPPTPGKAKRYRVTGARVLSEKNIPPSMRENDEQYGWMPGDVQIDIVDTTCRRGKCDEWIKGMPPTTYTTRRQGDRWIVLGWDSPRW